MTTTNLNNKCNLYSYKCKETAHIIYIMCDEINICRFMCHSAMGLTHYFKTAVFTSVFAVFST